ncbi:MAG: hypothetical protein Q8O84_00545, partial [Nanoarchaeota archaeon]|nr:hypothetical protein [Nanoarchaeota archaeon]
MEDLKKRVEKLISKINLDEKRKKIREIESESANPSFWKDHKLATSKMKELASLQKEVVKIENL